MTFKRIRMVISQPRLSVKPSEYDLSVEELEAWGRSTARSAVGSCRNAASTSSQVDRDGQWEDTFLAPGEKQCKFCRAKATCPALRSMVTETVTAGGTAADPEEFDDAMNYIPRPEVQDELWLSRCLDKADLIEDWCKAVRAEVERRLLAGESVPGYKVVQGKRGNRSWSKPADVEALFKSMRLKEAEMYDFKLISPTTADKLAKAGTIGPRQWPKVQELITQKDGAPHVAPVSDSRPALDIRPVAEDFAAVTDDLA